MLDDEVSVKRRRILRFIRDLDLRYIRGSIDRRTYQTLKNKYKELLANLPKTIDAEIEEKELEETKQKLPEVELDFHQIQKGELTTPIELESDTSPIMVEKEVEEIKEEVKEEVKEEAKEVVVLPPKPEISEEIELPIIELEEIPPIEIEELKIRYVMNMAIKAATKTFEEEMDLEQDYMSSKIDDQEYMGKKNEVEAKQHKIFQHFYKLSELLFSVSQDHLYKNTHNNFLLFNNELSENINRLRRLVTDKKELKGIIYDINERVLRHRPILRKAAQDTLKWKVIIQQEREKFRIFMENNEGRIPSIQSDELARKIKQLEIYEELLDEDINDYAKDLDALDVIYGEHLQFQEIITPYFKDLTLDTENRIQKYSEIISALQFRNQLTVATSAASREIDYQLLSELKALWRYSGKPVVDEQKDLVGFVVGPGQLNEKFGIIIRQQQELSLSMVRRIYDNIVLPISKEPELSNEREKKEFLLNELPRNIPQLPFTYLIPEAIVEYCKIKDIPLTEEIIEIILQPHNYLFVSLEKLDKTAREIRIKSQDIIQNGDVLPYFNPAESNLINDRITEEENIAARNVFGKPLGRAHSVIYHPMKGYFLVVEKKKASSEFFGIIYDFLHDVHNQPLISRTKLSLSEKKKKVLEDFAEEYSRTEDEIDDIDMLKRILIEKNTGFLPEKVENSRFLLFSMGNVRQIGNMIQVSYGSPSFELNDVFDLEGKVVENVKGTEIGVVYNLQLTEKPFLYLWTSIDLLLIASFISEYPASLFEKDQNFIDNLAISIGKQLSIAPQVALRPDIVMTFMNLIGKIKNLIQMEETMEKFKPKTIELSRIISVDKRKILADISDEEIMDEIITDIEVGDADDDSRFVTSPDYYLKEQ